MLILALIIILQVPKILDNFSVRDDRFIAEDKKILDSLLVQLGTDKSYGSLAEAPTFKPHKFNPNNVSSKELIALGFSEKISGRIVNYRNKGGSFKLRGDLYRIYDIDSAMVVALYNYIDLPEKKVEKANIQITKVKQVKEEKVSKVELPKFDINVADTAILQTIKGIGHVLSNRIIDYRNSLGGIVDVNQLFEVYNLDSIVTQRLITMIYIDDDFTANLLKINKVDELDIAAHPYISKMQARLIIAYRNQHGAFKSATDLLKVYAIEEKDVKKLTPYINWLPAN